MFTVKKQQPTFGKADCPRCGMSIYRAPSKKNPDKIVTVDERAGPYVLEEQDDGTIVAAWRGSSAGYAFHYNADFLCATDDDAEEANDD